MKSVVIALSLALLLQAAPARAIEPQTVEAVVFRNKVFDGFAYQDALVPSQVGIFTLLAGADNALTVTQTLEYYWPLSRQFYAAFDKLNEPLKGALRIAQDGRTVAEVTPETYVIVYPHGTTGGGAHMVWGEGAEKALADYKAGMLDDNRRIAAAQADRQRYDRDLKAAAIARIKGQAVADVAPPSAMPEPRPLYVTDVATAYRVNLPAGAYALSVIDDGLVVEGSARKLDVIQPATGSAVTIGIVPEERWTRTLVSNTRDDTLYAAPGKAFYAVLDQSDRFDEKAYRSLVDPQGFGRPGRDIWIRRGPAPGKRLEVRQADGSWRPVELEGYKVRQTQGAQLGYVIEPARPGETPEMSAYEVRMPAGGAVHPFGLRVVDVATGRVETERDVVVVSQADEPLLWGASAVPFLAGLGVVGFRRWRRRA